MVEGSGCRGLMGASILSAFLGVWVGVAFYGRVGYWVSYMTCMIWRRVDMNNVLFPSC